MITFFAITLMANAREPILKSRSGYYIALLIDRADAVMPAEVHDVIGPYLHDLEKKLDPALPPGTPRHQHPDDHGHDGKSPRTADAEPWQMFKGSTARNALRPAETEQSESADEPNPLRVLRQMVEQQGRPSSMQPPTTAEKLQDDETGMASVLVRGSAGSHDAIAHGRRQALSRLPRRIARLIQLCRAARESQSAAGVGRTQPSPHFSAFFAEKTNIRNIIGRWREAENPDWHRAFRPHKL